VKKPCTAVWLGTDIMLKMVHTVGLLRQKMKSNEPSASTITKDGHFMWITTEDLYILLYPLKGQYLIRKSVVAW
jgi:hypothetical protein